MKRIFSIILTIGMLWLGITAFTEAILTIGQYPVWMTIMGIGVGIGLIPDALNKAWIIRKGLKTES